MGCTLADFYNSPLNVQKNLRKKFNNMCENDNDNGLYHINQVYNKNQALMKVEQGNYVLKNSIQKL